MKKIKLLVLSNMYPSKEAKTFGIFVKNQVEALKQAGIDVDVVAVNNPNMGKANVIKKYSAWLLQTFANVLSRGKSYDVVHAHYVFPTGLLALAYKKLFGKRMIVTAHGGDIDRMAQKSPRIRRLTTQILQEADHVIAVGHELHQTIHEEFGVSKEKLSIINMGVNRQVFAPMDKQKARQIVTLSQDEKMILFVGNLIRQKGLIELVEAYEKVKERMPEASLYLIGATKDVHFRKELEEIIQARGLNDVHIMDALSQKEIATWMNAADLFVLPSHIEGFGLVALEAMSCHTPVVGTRVGGLRYLLADDAGVLVEPQNPHSLAEGIINVLENESFVEHLIENGEKQAQKNDQEQLIQRVLEVYSPLGG
ncbi:glycosyltransferase [Metabacillus iocasae]|uniref:Glycosyltransferase involved in cell wall biosynthesis n=1 Tax=Priestia iocasae TaxID=2291674 RepID=A0ABS2QYF6_9BACI|nr:glycosyltransferase [Metabacillus iocasae]MBM7703977.1 glycosyltransferase involved in cell wall biosynthesis [Metabacillus iocasae]